MSQPAIIAHRGNTIAAPENTMVAFRQALQCGATGIETDVRVSADDVAYLFHDAELGRITGAEGIADDLTIAELREFDAGAHAATKFANEKIPTLAELAHECRDRARLILDLKVEGAGRAIVAAMAESGMPEDQLSICAWTETQRRDARECLPEAELVYIDDRPHETAEDSWFVELRAQGFGGLSLSWQGLAPDVVTAARRHEMTILVWTVNTPTDMAAALASGVDGIITDDPAALRALATR